jgi:hypothetical protein
MNEALFMSCNVQNNTLQNILCYEDSVLLCYALSGGKHELPITLYCLPVSMASYPRRLNSSTTSL